MRKRGSGNSRGGNPRDEEPRRGGGARPDAAAVLEALLKEKFREAARLVIQGRDSGGFSTDAVRKLAAKAGHERFQKLLLALATQPCFGCKGGLIPCEVCDGHGHSSGEAICEQCVGLGYTRCDFCEGSGWISTNAIPAALRPLVILERMKQAVRRGQRAIGEPLPQVEAAEDGQARREAARALVRLERERGIAEDVLAASERAGVNSSLGRRIDRLAVACARTSRAVETQLHRCAGLMARAYRRAAQEGEDDPRKRRLAAARAEYYEALQSTPSFADSGLERRRLKRVTDMILGNGHPPESTEGSPAEPGDE
jgi:hypothetical protein